MADNRFIEIRYDYKISIVIKNFIIIKCQEEEQRSRRLKKENLQEAPDTTRNE